MESFGQRLKQMRVERHLTQSQLASELGVSTSAVSMYEKDNREPNRKMLKKICSFFGVGVNYLLYGSTKGPQDISQLLDDIKAQLDEAEGLMVNGQMINESDKDKLFKAMLVAANIMFDGNVAQKSPDQTKPIK